MVQLNRNTFSKLILVALNIILLIFLQKQLVNNKENAFFYKKTVNDIQKKNKTFIEDLIDCNAQIDGMLCEDIYVTNDSAQTLLLSEIINRYKIIIYFPKMACHVCLDSLFKLIKETPKFNHSDFLILSDSYSLGELKLYKKEFDLQNYDLYLLAEPEKMELFKYPIVFHSKKNRSVFIFDRAYPDLLKKFLSYDL